MIRKKSSGKIESNLNTKRVKVEEEKAIDSSVILAYEWSYFEHVLVPQLLKLKPCQKEETHVNQFGGWSDSPKINLGVFIASKYESISCQLIGFNPISRIITFVPTHEYSFKPMFWDKRLKFKRNKEFKIYKCVEWKYKDTHAGEICDVDPRFFLQLTIRTLYLVIRSTLNFYFPLDLVNLMLNHF